MQTVLLFVKRQRRTINVWDRNDQAGDRKTYFKKVGKNDAKDIFEGFVNQEEFLYYTNKKPRTLEEEKASLENIEEKYQNKNYYNWLITLKFTKQIIGSVNFNVNLKNDSVTFNYAIDNRFTNNGYMTEDWSALKNLLLIQ